MSEESLSTKYDVLILKKYGTAQEAQQAAQKEYEKLFNVWHPYIEKAIHYILRELFADENLIGYCIRVEFDEERTSPAKLAEIKAWTAEHLRSDSI